MRASDPILHGSVPDVNVNLTFNLSDCGNQCSVSGKIGYNQVYNDYTCINTPLTADFLQCLPTTATTLYVSPFLVERLSPYRILTIKFYLRMGPTFKTGHKFCTSGDTRVSYGLYLLLLYGRVSKGLETIKFKNLIG